MRVVTCLVEQHNLWLVVVAAVVCALGSWTSMRLYARVRRTDSYAVWIFLSAMTAGATVWCTHFVAMMAFDPGVPITYEPGLTILSLFIAIFTATIAMMIGAMESKYAGLIGGCLLGLGITAMHYSGMAAVSINSIVEWNFYYVSASIIAAMAFCTMALQASATQGETSSVFLAAAAFMGGIISLHFTAMAGMDLTLLPAMAGDLTTTAGRHFLATAVACAGLLILGAGAASNVLDRQLRAHAEARQRQLMESSVDCMVMVRDGCVTEVNSAFANLIGLPRAKLIGRAINDWLFDLADLERGALMSTSLRPADGEPIPVEVAVHREPRRGSDDMLTFYSIRDLRPRIAQEQELVSLIRNDSLTGLANRHWFCEQLEVLLATRCGKASMALLVVDIDRFKQINDTLGHAVGDALLQLTARRIRQAVGHLDIVARIGGDECASGVSVSVQTIFIEMCAEYLIHDLSQPFDINGYRGHIASSIGIALAPQDGTSAEELLKKADIAMHTAKAKGRGRFSYFETGMDEKLRERLDLEVDLSKALSLGQFKLLYQPQVDARSGKNVSCEALLRWHHPTRGMVPPMEFISIAEDLGLMGSIGAWVIKEACAEAAKWPEHVDVAVNVSATQFLDDTLETAVKEALQSSGLAPNRLEIEITESLLLTDTDRVIQILHNLRALGARIAMDDFGTGYSSLGYLARLPMDKVKIDRSFVMNCCDKTALAVIRAIVSLTQNLGITTTAEGVETHEQAKLLRNEGCTLLQGYFFSKPIEARDVRALHRVDPRLEIA